MGTTGISVNVHIYDETEIKSSVLTQNILTAYLSIGDTTIFFPNEGKKRQMVRELERLEQTMLLARAGKLPKPLTREEI